MIVCAQQPVRQIKAAQKNIDDAKSAGAEIYAKDEFMKLEQEFALTKDEMVKQETVFSILRLYDDVDEMLSMIIKYGRHVVAKASENKEVTKAEALAMEQDALWAVVATKRLMASAMIKTERHSGEVIKLQVTALEALLTEIHRFIKNGDYLAAKMQTGALKEKGVAVFGALSKRLAEESQAPMCNDYRIC